MVVTRPRYRCPQCRVIRWRPDDVCRGGYPIYDPARPGAYDDPHPPTRVVPDHDAGGHA